MEFYWKILLISAAFSCLIGQSLSQTETDYMRELKRGVRVTGRIMTVKSLGNGHKDRALWQDVLSNITMLIDQQQAIEDLLNKAQQNTVFGSGDPTAARNPDIETLTAAKVVMEETVQHLCPWLQSVAKHQFTDGTPFNCTMEEIKILGLRMRLATTAIKMQTELSNLVKTDKIIACEWIKDNLLCKLSADALGYVSDHYNCGQIFTPAYIQTHCS